MAPHAQSPPLAAVNTGVENADPRLVDTNEHLQDAIALRCPRGRTSGGEEASDAGEAPQAGGSGQSGKISEYPRYPLRYPRTKVVVSMDDRGSVTT